MSMRSNGWDVTVGLALGAGGPHGWAHIGVIKELVDHGIVPDVVMGCSAGALVGACYAARRLDVLEHWARSQTLRDMMAHMRLRLGHTVFAPTLLEQMAEHFQGVDIRSLPIRFGAVATDLERGTRRVIVEGPLLSAIAASSAFPMLFPPVRIDGDWLIDGCLTDPVPAALARSAGADLVIGVPVLDFGGTTSAHSEAGEGMEQWRDVLRDEKQEQDAHRPQHPLGAWLGRLAGRAVGRRTREGPAGDREDHAPRARRAQARGESRPLDEPERRRRHRPEARADADRRAGHARHHRPGRGGRRAPPSTASASAPSTSRRDAGRRCSRSRPSGRWGAMAC